MKPLRSLLFVPGNKAAWMEKAPQYGADARILDLEDAVPLADKPTARTLVRQVIEKLSARGQTLYVRVNALDTDMTGMVDIAMLKTSQEMLEFAKDVGVHV